MLAVAAHDGFNDAHDKIKGIYEGAEVPISECIAITSDDARPERWHYASLERVCQLQTESQQDEVWASLAA